jgi:hypothetical protein
VGAGEKGTVKKDLHEATPPYNDGGEAKGQGNKYMKSWLYSFYFFLTLAPVTDRKIIYRRNVVLGGQINCDDTTRWYIHSSCCTCTDRSMHVGWAAMHCFASLGGLSVAGEPLPRSLIAAGS